MSVEGSLRKIFDDDDVTSNNLMTFCMKLVHHSQWKSTRRFLCGSNIEIPLYHAISRQFEVNDNMLDTDRMICDTRNNAFHRSSTLPNE